MQRTQSRYITIRIGIQCCPSDFCFDLPIRHQIYRFLSYNSEFLLNRQKSALRFTSQDTSNLKLNLWKNYSFFILQVLYRNLFKDFSYLCIYKIKRICPIQTDKQTSTTLCRADLIIIAFVLGLCFLLAYLWKSVNFPL